MTAAFDHVKSLTFSFILTHLLCFSIERNLPIMYIEKWLSNTMRQAICETPDDLIISVLKDLKVIRSFNKLTEIHLATSTNNPAS